MNYRKPKTEQEFIALFKLIAKKEFNYIVDVPVEFNSRYKSTLGSCWWEYNNTQTRQRTVKFDFNLIMIDEKYPMKEVLDTIRHELCHNEVHRKYDRICKAHGKEFIEEAKKHNVKVAIRRKKQTLGKTQYHQAICECCGRVVAKSKNKSKLYNYMARSRGTVCNCENGNGMRSYLDKAKNIKYIYNHGLSQFNFYPEHWNDDLAEEWGIILCKENGNENGILRKGMYVRRVG